MIINQNTLAVLRTFSNLQKDSTKHFTPRRQLLLLNFLAKFLTERKYLVNSHLLNNYYIIITYNNYYNNYLMNN